MPEYTTHQTLLERLATGTDTKAWFEFHDRYGIYIVFGTKFRRTSIRSEIVESFYEYIGGTIRNRKGNLLQIGGIEDHLHLLVGLPPTITVSDAVRDIKANASKWIHENRNDTRNASDKFEWQIGYGAFTVS